MYQAVVVVTEVTSPPPSVMRLSIQLYSTKAGAPAGTDDPSVEYMKKLGVACRIMPVQAVGGTQGNNDTDLGGIQLE